MNSGTQESSPPPGSQQALAVGLGALRIERSGFRFNGGLPHWIENLTNLESRSPSRDARLRELALQIADNKVKAQILKELGEGESGADLSQDAVLRRLVLDPAYIREASVAAVYNDEDQSTSIEDMLADPTLADETRQGLMLAAELRERLGFVTLRHVEDIHLTSCLVGYTRGDYDPTRVQLQLYLDSSGGRRQYLVYTNTVQTEGIYFQLSPTNVLRWLTARSGEPHQVSGQYSQDLLSLQSAFEDAHIPVFAPPTHDWCRYYYSVLHTVSHLFIRQLGRFSGLEQEGLSEEIYPYQCSALVYVNQGAEFSLEGLRLSFEHHLAEILEGIVQDSKACVYDPECEVFQGACHGCIQLAEISCTNFNRLLDRRLLSPTKPGGLWS